MQPIKKRKMNQLKKLKLLKKIPLIPGNYVISVKREWKRLGKKGKKHGRRILKIFVLNVMINFPRFMKPIRNKKKGMLIHPFFAFLEKSVIL